MLLLDRKLLRDLRAFRGQALGVVLVLACAAATVSMAYSARASLEATREEYYRHQGFADLFASVVRAPLPMVKSIRQVPGVAAVAARVVGWGTVAVDGFDEPITGRLISLPDDDGPAVNRLVLQQGHTPVTNEPDQVVVNEGFATAHGLAPGSRLAATIGGHKRVLTIVGSALSPEYIFALGPLQIVPDNRRFALLWMSGTALAADLELANEFNDLAIRLHPGASAAEVAEALNRLMSPFPGAAVHGRNQQFSHAFVSSQLEELAAIGVLVPLLFLAVAVFLLNASLLRIIELQRQQIGILKALGLDDGAIAWHYVKFALVLAGSATALGLPVGIVLGYGVTRIYAEFFRFPFLHFTPDWPAVIGVLVALGAAATLAAWPPTWLAMALPPAVAMRPPSPPSYIRIGNRRPARRSTAPLFMILRQLARHPTRLLLTTAMVALAVGLEIATLFSLDALDEMADVFYQRAQRQDATIVFAAPLPPQVLADLARWPDVQRVEGYRALSARVSFGGSSRQVVLTGLPADGTLHRLLDLELVQLAVPEAGLALSRSLATILRIEPGEHLTVSPMTGGAFEVPVVALVEQYVGLGAYMELAALDGRLGGEPMVTGAEVALAGNDRSGFYRTLKESAFVAGFIPRAATIAAFRETMARTLTIIVSFFVAFAGIAAWAIVDATVRVALSERQREFAILRALGFSHGAVVSMLAGELGVAVAAALPLGALAGLGLGQLIVWTLDNELFHVPLVVGWRSFVLSIGVVLAAAIISFAMAARRMRGTDLQAALRIGAS
jgi:putative ABC transport system permease protein